MVMDIFSGPENGVSSNFASVRGKIFLQARTLSMGLSFMEHKFVKRASTVV